MMLARSLYARFFFGFSDDVDRDSADLCAAAERAVTLEDRDPYSHYVMCLAHFTVQRAQAAVAEALRAIDLNPNLALAHMALGWARIFTGNFAEALDPLHTALRLSPHDPLTYLFLNRIALAHYHLGNYEEALHFSMRAHSLRRVYFNLIVMVASLGQLGRREEAGEHMPEIAASTPADTQRYWQVLTAYVDPGHQAHFMEGLGKAGLAVAQ